MLADVEALPGYEWVPNAGWAVDTDYTRTDEATGWSYAFDFHRLPVLLRSGQSVGEETMNLHVRRRKWLRFVWRSRTGPDSERIGGWSSRLLPDSR